MAVFDADGYHIKDGGAPGGVADILDLPTAEMDDSLVLAPDGAGGVEFRAEAGGAGGGHTIEDETTPLTARTKLSFAGAGVTATDDAGNDVTVVTIPGGGGGDFLVSQIFN
jgi:hypothetical protein